MDGRSVIRRVGVRWFYRLTGRGELLPGIRVTDALYHGPREAIDRVVDGRLRDLLRRALKNVPYYRELGVSAADWAEPGAGMAVLSRMPVLTKSIIRREGERMVSSQPGRKCVWNTSGGSTGEPVRLMQDAEMRNQATANKYLFTSWLGHVPGDRHVYVWGVPQQTFDAGFNLHDRIYQHIHNEVYMNCYRISQELCVQWLDAIDRLRPAILECYTDAADAMSRLMLSEGRRTVPLQGILTSAGVLTSEIRERIEQAFQCKVLDRYGSREVADVACSCPQNTELHISEAMYHVEIVDEQGRACPPGVEGDVLVTLFTNHTMPLIRYRIEDRAVFGVGPCACGRQTRRLARITGRVTDVIVARDGTKISGIALTTLLYGVPGMERFQYRQDAGGKVTLLVVPLQGTDRSKLTGDLRQPLDNLSGYLKGIPVGMQYVEDIPPTPSGKYRYIYSECNTATHTSFGS